MTNPEYAVRRVSASDLDLLLDEFFLADERYPLEITGGRVILGRDGLPLCKILDLPTGEHLLYIPSHLIQETADAVQKS